MTRTNTKRGFAIFAEHKIRRKKIKFRKMISSKFREILSQTKFCEIREYRKIIHYSTGA
jgi:hypothetical protein